VGPYGKKFSGFGGPGFRAAIANLHFKSTKPPELYYPFIDKGGFYLVNKQIHHDPDMLPVDTRFVVYRIDNISFGKFVSYHAYLFSPAPGISPAVCCASRIKPPKITDQAIFYSANY
jgi:hypothetical protein